MLCDISRSQSTSPLPSSLSSHLIASTCILTSRIMGIVLMEDKPENADSPAPHDDQTPQSQVQDYIDNTLAAALAELDSPDGNPAITLTRRYKKGAFFINHDNGALETSETETQISYTWPGKDRHEAWRFSMTLSTLTLRLIVAILIATAVVFRVLEAIAQAIGSGLVVSKRYEF